MTIDTLTGRRDHMMARLAAGQGLNSAALATEFSISEDAVRRDLRALAAAGLCRRVYGGALPLAPGSTSMAHRVREGLTEKRALARAIVPLLGQSRFIFFDNGSTNLIVAEELPDGLDLTIATSSIDIAAALATRRDLRLIVVGGEVDPVIGGCVDGAAIEAVSRMNFDLCLLGACTLSPIRGLSAFEFSDAAFKRVLVARSHKTIVAVTNEKLERQAPYNVTGLSALAHIVLEHNAPPHHIADLEAAGASVVRAAPPASSRDI